MARFARNNFIEKEKLKTQRQTTDFYGLPLINAGFFFSLSLSLSVLYFLLLVGNLVKRFSMVNKCLKYD